MLLPPQEQLNKYNSRWYNIENEGEDENDIIQSQQEVTICMWRDTVNVDVCFSSVLLKVDHKP